MIKNIIRIITLAACMVLIAIATATVGYRMYIVEPVLKEGAARTVIVKGGMTFREVSKILEQEGLIKNSKVFLLWARVKGYTRLLKAGEYNLSPAMSPERIMEMLTRGEIITHLVTIPEGFSIEKIADVLSENNLINREAFLSYTISDGIQQRYGINGNGLEGYLYPDTYHFARGLEARAIVDSMIDRFREVTGPYLADIANSGMSLHEVVTLASIIEKETGKADERPLIASVFLNRLKKRMRLESDPTVIYGIKNFSGNIKKKDLSTRTPYNTYVIKGLPPGPIANPGLDSVRAVLFPADTDFLFFVSKNDGSHHFSKSLKEHNRAVYIYQKKR